MKNFGFIKSICFGLVLFLAGCAEFRDQSPPQVTTCEALNMKLDVSTKDQAEDILKSHGYLIKYEVFNAQDIIRKNKEYKDLPESVVSFLTKLSEKQSIIGVPISADDREWMKFFFDKDQKLIGFAAQGRRNVLDPLITRDNKSREVLINLDSSLLSGYTRSKGKGKHKKDKWDVTVYLGKDLSFVFSAHTDDMKDMTAYSVMSPGSIYQTILAVRDFFKTK